MIHAGGRCTEPRLDLLSGALRSATDSGYAADLSQRQNLRMRTDSAPVFTVCSETYNYGIGLAIESLCVRLDFRLSRSHVMTLGKLFTHVPLSPSSLIRYWPKVGDALHLGW